MKSETLNGILTFALGVLVIAGVILAVRMVMLHRDLRTLQKDATRDQAIIMRTQQFFNEAAAYNQKNPSPELTRVLQILAPPKPTNSLKP